MTRLATCSFFALTAMLAGQTVETIATDLQFPQRLVFTAGGNLLVSEGGTPEANTGRISFLDRQGSRRSLMEGLPSGLAHFTNPFGPTAMALEGRTLYLAVGEGDVMAGLPPQYGINTKGPSSPIFSSVLRFRFNRPIDDIRSTFRLEMVHHWGLFDGYEIYLNGSAGDQAEVLMLTAFRPLIRNVLAPSAEVDVRPSNPYGLALDRSGQFLYVVDGSGETISKIDTKSGRATTVFRFEPYLRTEPTGKVPRDNVPTSACWMGERLVIGQLTAAPFPDGEAALRLFDPGTRQMMMLAGGFGAISDVACSSNSNSVAVAEFTSDFGGLLSGLPNGRIKLYRGSAATVLARNVTATGVALDPRTDDVYATSFLTLGNNGVPIFGHLFRIRAR